MLNIHTFPLVPLPGPAPEQAQRAAGGGWDAYALAAPHDRLLPFVLTRPAATQGQAAWVNCAWIEHADNPTQRFVTLFPTGPTAGGPGNGGLVLTKIKEPARGLEHFVYAGAIVPGMNLYCGIPLRLVIDGVWQSPRFTAYPDLSGHLRLEWWHPASLGGVPYGAAGLRQRLYVAGAGLAYAPPARTKTTAPDPTTGQTRTTYLALTRRAALTTEPLPPYLAQALDGAEAHEYLEADGEAWELAEVKAAVVGQAGGRWAVALTLEQTQVLIARACPAPPLTAHVYNAVADAARPWRCGVTTDTASDWQPFGARVCRLDAGGFNDGTASGQERDINPFSTTTGQTRAGGFVADPVNCPVPPTYLSSSRVATATRNNCPAGQTGQTVVSTMPQGYRTSRVSQANADALALAAAPAYAQAQANATGTCTTTPPPGTSWQPVYNADGCFSGTMVDAVDASNVRTAEPAESAAYCPAGSRNNNGELCLC